VKTFGRISFWQLLSLLFLIRCWCIRVVYAHLLWSEQLPLIHSLPPFESVICKMLDVLESPKSNEFLSQPVIGQPVYNTFSEADVAAQTHFLDTRKLIENRILFDRTNKCENSYYVTKFWYLVPVIQITCRIHSRL
jgi:hypothetical protein